MTYHAGSSIVSSNLTANAFIGMNSPNGDISTISQLSNTAFNDANLNHQVPLLLDCYSLRQEPSSLGHQNFNANPQSAGFHGPSNDYAAWQLSSMSSVHPSTPLDELPNLYSSSSTSEFFSNHDTAPSLQRIPTPQKQNSRKHASPNSSSSFSNNPIKQNKLKARISQPRKVLTQLENTVKSSTLSQSFKEQSAPLIALFKLLMDKEIGPGDEELDKMSFTMLDNQGSLCSSDIEDSGYRTEESDPVGHSTPRQEDYGAQAATPRDTKPEQTLPNLRVRFYCTYPKCNFFSYAEGEWERHEKSKKHWPQERFLCLECSKVSVGDPTCAFCRRRFSSISDVKTHYLQCGEARENGKSFGRDDHLREYLWKQHIMDDMNEAGKTWNYAVQSAWPRQCGFCGILVETWDQRIMHIVRHYKKGVDIKIWRLPFPRPKRLRSPGLFPSYKKDDDDDQDDNSGGSRGNTSGYGCITVAPQDTQHGQSNSAQEYGSHFQQGYYQQGYGTAFQYPLHGGTDSGDGHRRKPELLHNIKTKPGLALEKYLNDTNDRVPALWTQSAKQNTNGYAPLPYAHRHRSPSCPKTIVEFNSISTTDSILSITGEGIFVLRGVGGFGKTQLALDYLNKHQKHLPGGIFWLNSKADPGTKDSLWNITIQIVREYSKTDPIRRKFFHNWWQNIRYDLRGTSLPPIWPQNRAKIYGYNFYRSSALYIIELDSSTRYFKVKAGEEIDLIPPPNSTGKPPSRENEQQAGNLKSETWFHATEEQPRGGRVQWPESVADFKSVNRLKRLATFDPVNDRHMKCPRTPIPVEQRHTSFGKRQFEPDSPETIIASRGDYVSAHTEHVHRRGLWSRTEDAYLIQLVGTQGALNWVRIAQHIGSRSPKQCRERYHQFLKPTLNHEPISPEEGIQIERLVREMGKRWAEIARRLHGRSDNDVKNWWNGSINRRRRLVLHPRTSDNCSKFFDQRFSFSSRPNSDILLASPTLSEASTPKSVDSTPSLIADSSSTFSVSSPAIELSPLNFDEEPRRPILPVLPFKPNRFLSEADNQAYIFGTGFYSDSKSCPVIVLSPPLYRRDQQQNLSTALSGTVQLPPLQLRTRQEQSTERDSRMRLSSLLG